jgi:acyl-homoserine lactone acylase PvdQ
LFQMDLWRRSVQGRLAEVLGPNFVERDAMTRRMQFRGDAKAEWESYGPDTQAIATAFVRGVNAWVSRARERRPEEFVLAGWSPELWAPEDLLSRTDAFATGGDAIDEIFRARLAAAVGSQRAKVLVEGELGTAVPSPLDVSTISRVVADAIRRVGTPPFFVGLASAVRTSSGDATAHPTRSTSVTYDDTYENPSPRYLVHLNAPGWNVIGAVAPWLPGVTVGHNDRVGWDAEPAVADTQDVFVERLNPGDPHQVEDNGRWVNTQRVQQPIGILRHPKPFVFEYEFTRHGVIVASDLARHLAFAVRWTGSEPGTAAELGALALDRATSVGDVSAALARWKLPARRFTYTDVEGGRVTQIAAMVPVRRGWNGALPAPAWIAVNDWVGWRRPDVPSGDRSGARLTQWARAHPDGADALLGKLAAAAALPGAAASQRALIDAALAPAAADADTASKRSAGFVHPLAVTDAARRRFNIGPLAPVGPNGRSSSPPARERLVFNPGDWDGSTAMNAPGQSGSPDSPHFSDLATKWAAGEWIGLPFTNRAVEAATESTLTLTPPGQPGAPQK